MITKKTGKYFLGYGVIAAITYSVLFTVIYVLADKFEINSQIAFGIAYLIGYTMSYTLQSNYLFKSGHSTKILIKYFSQICVFFVAGNLIFFLFESVFRVHYSVATILTILLLFPLRFLYSKKIVFK